MLTVTLLPLCICVPAPTPPKQSLVLGLCIKEKEKEKDISCLEKLSSLWEIRINLSNSNHLLKSLLQICFVGSTYWDKPHVHILCDIKP